LEERLYILSAIKRWNAILLSVSLTILFLANQTAAIADEVALQVVSIDRINGLVPPAAGLVPVETITATAEFTGSVTWSDANGQLDGNFEAMTIYQATVILNARGGYTFNSLAQDFFSIDGASNVTFDYESNNTGVVTAIFYPQFSDANDLLDNTFAQNGLYKFIDVFGSTPLTERSFHVGPVKVDRFKVDSQNRIVVLATMQVEKKLVQVFATHLLLQHNMEMKHQPAQQLLPSHILGVVKAIGISQR
jgi:hypothetical protein